MRKTLLCHRFVVIALSAVLFASAASAETYTWTDNNGNIHIVDDLSKIPPEKRKKDAVPTVEEDGRSASVQERRQDSVASREKAIGIEIIDYGIFTYKDFGTIPDKTASTGQLTVGNLNTLKLVKKTDQIPAVLGIKFGMRYRLNGATPGEQVMITTRVQTPGLKKIIIDGPSRPYEQSATYEEKWSSPKRIGEVTYDGFLFEKDWELVPGTWIIQIFYGDTWMGEQIFEVYQEEKKDDPAIPAEIRSEMDKLSSEDCTKRLNAVRQLEDMGRKAAPAVPALIRTMRYYSLPSQIAFDCGSGKAAPGALAKIGQPAIKPLIHALSDSELIIREGAKEALARIGKPASKTLINAFKRETDMYRRLGAAEVLGLLKEKQAVVPLISVLDKDPLPPVKGKAAEVLGILKDKRAVGPLTSVILNKNENWHVRSDALNALLKIEGKKAVQKVLSSLGDETDPTFRSVVAEMTGLVDDGRTAEQLATGLNDTDYSVRASSLQGLSRKKDNASRDSLIAALQNPDWGVRRSAAGSLGDAGDRRAVEPLIHLLKDKDWNVRTAAATALGKLKDTRAVEPLMEMYKTERIEKQDIRPSAIRALSQIGDKRATDLIMAAVNDNNMYVRRAATEALGDMKDERSVGLLIDIMKEKIPGAAYEAKISLGKMGEPAIQPLIQSLKGEKNHGNRLHAMEALTAIGAPAVELLIKALQNSDPYVKGSAAEVLGKLMDSRAVVPLIKTLNDHTINHASARSLGLIGAPSIKPLAEAMGAPHPQHRMYIVMALGETKNKLAAAPLVKALEDSDPRVRSNAAKGLGTINDAKAIPPLLRCLKDQDSEVRSAASYALGMIKISDPNVVVTLIQTLNDKYPDVRREAAGALGRIGDKRAFEPLLRMLQADRESRWVAVQTLGQLKDKRATEHIIPFLKDADQQVRLQAAGALAGLQDKKAIPGLIEALNDNNRDVKWGVANALRTITKKDFGMDPAEWTAWLKRSQKKGT